MSKDTNNHGGLQLKNALVVVLVVMVVLGGGRAFSKGAIAQLAPPSFGGRITMIDYCTCSGGIRVTIGPPRPAVLLFYPGLSQLFMFYAIYTPGPWVLGTYYPGAMCLQQAGKYCRTLPVQGLMLMVGTSLF